jgi:hypothetical protein
MQAVTPQIDLAQVRIEPFPPARGRKLVLVGDVPFATIYMQGIGGSGNYFWFEQAGGHGQIEIDAGYTRRDGTRAKVAFKVYGNKSAERHRKLTDPPLAPIADRLLAAARELIRDGLLVSETDYKTRQATELKAWRAECATEEKKKEAALAARARRAIDAASKETEGDAMPDVVRDRLITEIVDAMKWAQTQ